MLPIFAGIVSLLADKGLELVSGAINGGADKAVDFIEEKTGIKIDGKKLSDEQLAKLKEFEMTHRLELEKLALLNKQEDNRANEAIVSIQASEYADARDMQKASLSQDDLFSKRFIYYFAIFWSVFAVLYLIGITFLEIPKENLYQVTWLNLDNYLLKLLKMENKNKIIDATYNSKGKKISIKNKFIQFLKSDKNFPDDSFLLNYHYVDKGGIISFLQTVTEYTNIKKENESIKDKLSYFSWIKNKDDEKEMFEQFFKYLEDRNIIEKENINNTDKYKVLNSISYYISIVESVEKGDEND